MHHKFRLEDGSDAVTRILVPHGDLGADGADELRRRVDDALAAGKRRVIVDLSETEYMETAAVAALLDANARGRRFGATTIVVAPADSRVRDLLVTTQLDEVLNVVESRNAAP